MPLCHIKETEFLVKNSGINLHVLTRSGSFNTDGNGAKFCYALLLTGLVTKSLTTTTWKAILGRGGGGLCLSSYLDSSGDL